MAADSRVIELDDIARGDVDLEVAHTVILQHLKQPSEEVVEELYVTLRSWVWNVINERRRDSELKRWFDAIRGIVSFLRKNFSRQADRLSVLCELLHESITVSEEVPASVLLQRSHVREIIELLHLTRGRPLERSEICTTLHFKQANLSRVMALLTANGLVDRLRHGKSALYMLTAKGQVIAEKLFPRAAPLYSKLDRIETSFSSSIRPPSKGTVNDALFVSSLAIRATDHAAGRPQFNAHLTELPAPSIYIPSLKAA